MSIAITVNSDLFIITVDDNTTLTKNKDDIFCDVSSSVSSVVEIWETSPKESDRTLIFSSDYSNFSTPTGSTAATVCYGINQLLKNESPLNEDAPHCYLSSNVTHTIADPTVGQEITFDTNEIINNMTHSVSVNTSRIYIDYAGVYVIHMEAIVTSASANKEAYFWLRVDGNDVVRSCNQQSMVNASDTKAATFTWQYDFEVGQYFEVIFGGNSTGISLNYVSTITNPTRPTTPSVNISIELI